MSEKTPWIVIYNALTEYAKNCEATSLAHAQIREWVASSVADTLEVAGMIRVADEEDE